MKKIVSYLLACMMMLTVMAVPAYDVYGANISLSVSASSVDIGDTVTATVSVPSGITATIDVYFPTDLFEFVTASGTTNVNGGTVTTTLGEPFSSSVSVKLKAKTTGTAKISASAIKAGNNNNVDADGNPTSITLSGASKSVTIENKIVEEPNTGSSEESETPKSADNSLSSLKLSAGKLSPSFKGNVTKYTATVDYDVTKLVVSAKASNAKATIESVTGNGNVSLKVGENTIKIVVKAENGVQATYTIVVTRKEKETTPSENPSSETPDKPQNNENSEQTIETQVEEQTFEYNGQKLNIIEEIPQEVIPGDFAKENILIDGKETPGLRFTKSELQVLYLENESGYGSLYVYDKAEQEIYPLIRLASEKNYVIVLRPDDETVPKGFTPCTFSIEGKGTVQAYRYEEQEAETETTGLFGAENYFAAQPVLSDFYLIYCVNSSGELGWYQFDSVEGTFQRYLGTVALEDETVDADAIPENGYEAEIKALKSQQKMMLSIFAGVCLVLLIVVISLAVSKHKLSQAYKKAYVYGEETKQEEQLLNTAKENEIPVTETANVSYLEKMIGAYAASEEESETAVSKRQEDAENSDFSELEEVKSGIEVAFSNMSQESVKEELPEAEPEDEVEIEFFEMSKDDEKEEVPETEIEDEVEIEFFEMTKDNVKEELAELESEDDVDVEFFEMFEDDVKQETTESDLEDDVDVEFFEVSKDNIEEVSETESEKTTEFFDMSNQIIKETELTETESEDEVEVKFFDMSDEILEEATAELKNEIKDTFFEKETEMVNEQETVEFEDESEDEVEVEFFNISDEITEDIVEDIEETALEESEDEMEIEFFEITTENAQETESVEVKDKVATKLELNQENETEATHNKNENQSDSDDEEDDDLEFIDL